MSLGIIQSVIYCNYFNITDYIELSEYIPLFFDDLILYAFITIVITIVMAIVMASYVYLLFSNKHRKDDDSILLKNKSKSGEIWK
jgi:hypothetical protein